MRIFEKHNSKTYRVSDGTWYDASTPDGVIVVLNRARNTMRRVRVFYGYTKDVPEQGHKAGKAWPEENDVSGYIGRSGGQVRVPLMLATKRSSDGPPILDDCIIAILFDGHFVYKREGFDVGTWLHGSVDGATWEVRHNGELHARFDTEIKAKRYAAFMRGERMTK